MKWVFYFYTRSPHLSYTILQANHNLPFTYKLKQNRNFSTSFNLYTKGRLKQKIQTAFNHIGWCKPPPTFALCCSNFCTLGSAKVLPAFALYRMMRNKKSDDTVAFYFTNYIRPILHWLYRFYFFRLYKPAPVE